MRPETDRVLLAQATDKLLISDRIRLENHPDAARVDRVDDVLKRLPEAWEKG
jgi:hypothetical protein